MKNNHPTFEEAAQAFLETVENWNLIPEQPSRELSELKGTTWHLWNVRGPIGQVNRFGDVSITVREVEE